jgi:hypothetical protein
MTATERLEDLDRAESWRASTPEALFRTPSRASVAPPKGVTSYSTKQTPPHGWNRRGQAPEVEAPPRPEPTSATGADDVPFLRCRDRQEVASCHAR